MMVCGVECWCLTMNAGGVEWCCLIMNVGGLMVKAGVLIILVFDGDWGSAESLTWLHGVIQNDNGG